MLNHRNEKKWTQKKKQNVIDVKRIIIRKQNQTINTTTYILTFNNPNSSAEILKDWVYDNKSGENRCNIPEDDATIAKNMDT